MILTPKIIEEKKEICLFFLNTVDLSFFVRYRSRNQTCASFFLTLSIKVHRLNYLNEQSLNGSIKINNRNGEKISQRP